MRVVVPPRLGRPEGRRVPALRVEEEPGRDVLQAVQPREAPALRPVVGPHGAEVHLVRVLRVAVRAHGEARLQARRGLDEELGARADAREGRDALVLPRRRGLRRRRRAAPALVERFDSEPYSDFSTK